MSTVYTWNGGLCGSGGEVYVSDLSRGPQKTHIHSRVPSQASYFSLTNRKRGPFSPSPHALPHLRVSISLCAGSARAVCVRCDGATTEITTVHSVGVPSKCWPPSMTYRLRGRWAPCTSPVPAANTRSGLSALFVVYHRLLLLVPCWFHDLMEVVRSNWQMCVFTVCVRFVECVISI